MTQYGRLWIVLFLFGILLRVWCIAFALQYRENTDILRWKDWGRISYLQTLADTYTPKYLMFGTLPNNMPPGTLYIASGSYRINILISKLVLRITHKDPGSNQFLNSTLLTIILRLPSMFFDSVIAMLIYIILKKNHGAKAAVVSSMLFFLNPITLYNSAIWGQMDSIPTGLFVLAFYWLHKKQFTIACIAVAFSLFVKLSLVFLLPMFIAACYVFSKSMLQTLKSTAVSVALLVLAVFPISSSPISWIWTYLTLHATGEMQNITAFAFNFWWFFFSPVLSIVSDKNVFEFSEIRLTGSPLVSQAFLGISFGVYAAAIFILSLLPFLKIWIVQKEKFFKPRKLFLFSALISLLAFLLLPKMHERYMYPVFPFLALAIGFGAPFLSEFASLTFFHLLNLMFVWHPMKELLPLYPAIHNSFIQWGISAFMVMTAIRIYWKSYIRLRST